MFDNCFFNFLSQEGVTKVDKLSLVLNGKVAVMRKKKVVHLIDTHQFIDSPEWFGVGSSDTYQVTVIALEPTKIMTWHRDKLKLCIADNDYLKAMLDNILGRDVVKKLLYSLEHPARDFDSLTAMTNANKNETNGPTNETTKLIKNQKINGKKVTKSAIP